jgi:hypothetical protein
VADAFSSAPARPVRPPRREESPAAGILFCS